MSMSGAQAQTRLVPALPDLTGVISTATVDGKTGLQWAAVLGKALFWDQQAGSDGVACASCHFNAGADSRLVNQLSPGANDVTAATGGDGLFGSTRSDTGQVASGQMPSAVAAAPNYALKTTDFPFHRLADETDRNASLVTTTNDVVSSQGAFAAPFTSVNINNGVEICGTASAELFHVGGRPARQVAKRQTSPTINAVFNRRTLWDGSANNIFNGVGSFGMRDIVGDPNKRLIVLNSAAQPELGFLQLRNASLASQAVGPPVNSVEMSCQGRRMADLGRKLMATNIRPLRRQTIDPTDTLLAGLIDPSGSGLAAAHNYAALVQRAFDPKYWSATGRFAINNGVLTTARGRAGYTQIENNWSMFWGIAILLYEATLVSNTSEFDGLVATGLLTVRDNRTGPPFDCTANGTVDPLLLRGCELFFRDQAATPAGAGCHNCHGGRELFTSASTVSGQRPNPLIRLGNVLNPAVANNLFDAGFQNVGLRPVFTDLKLGGVDPYGNPLSYTRQYMNYLRGIQAGESEPDALLKYVHDLDLQTDIQNNSLFSQPGVSVTAAAKENVDGAAKAPSMRNVALTPPYTSNGSFATLRQVLKVYNRGSNRRDITAAGDVDAMGTACTAGDSSGTGTAGNQTFDQLKQTAQTCHTNTADRLQPLLLSDCDAAGSGCDPATDDLAALTRFLRSLSDPRVQCDSAPFDHPSLNLTRGHRDSDNNGDGKADDLVFNLPAVGASGYAAASGFCIPNAGDLFAPGMQGRAGGPLVPLPAP